jgi:phage tail sheath protein FI
MPADYFHGTRVIEIPGGARPIRTIATAILGMVCTASDADATAFPLNKPVLLTNVQQAIGKAGKLGTLAKALTAIAAQSKPLTVVVRVEEGETSAETDSNVIGNTLPDGSYTGLQALLSAQSLLGVTPRILGVPYHDTEPVAQALAGIAQKLRAFTYVSGNGATPIGGQTEVTKEAVTSYRKKFGQREVMVIWPDFTGFDVNAQATVDVSAVAVAMGLRAKLDNDIGWHKNISNVAVNGVTGISKAVSWALQDPDTDAGYLNSNDVTTLIQKDGFRFWGSRTCSDDPRFAFEQYTRTAQVLADTMAEAQMLYNDKPLSAGLVRDMIEGINAKLRAQTTAGYLMGGEAWYDEAENEVTDLNAGKLIVSYAYTAVPSLENITLNQRVTDTYLMNFASTVNTGS